MPQPLALTDAELSAIMIACEPLAPEKRGAFLQAVADALATCPIERDGGLQQGNGARA